AGPLAQADSGAAWEVDGRENPSGEQADNPEKPDIPDKPDDPNRYPHVATITVVMSSMLSGADGARLPDPDGREHVAADPELLYPTNCTYTKDTFSCTAIYNSNSPGWTGDVILKSNKNIYRSGSGSCANAGKTLSIHFSGISQNQTLAIIAC